MRALGDETLSSGSSNAWQHETQTRWPETHEYITEYPCYTTKLGFSFVAGNSKSLNHGNHTHEEIVMTQEEQVVTDPVCQMKIKPSDAVASIEHDGTTYHFCSQDCADSFRESPEDYV